MTERNLSEGIRRREEGAAAVATANEDFKLEILDGIKLLCRERLVWNPDDVHDYIPALPKGVHSNIIGSAVKTAAGKSYKYCRRLPFSTMSERPNQNATRIFWYASNLARYKCRACDMSGLLHEVDREAGEIFTVLCACPLGQDNQFRELVFSQYE